MKKFATVLATFTTLVIATQAQAKHYYRSYHHVYSHHFGHYLAYRHWRHMHRRYAHRLKHFDHPQSRSFALTKARLPDGQTITVNAPYADRFIGFFRELFDREWKLPEIGCYAAHGHMPLPWGRHPAGEACDVGQRSRNVAWAPMLRGRITQLAHQWGLTDGCEWRRNPDCGHVQINRAIAVVPALVPHALAVARRPRAYQVAGAWPL